MKRLTLIILLLLAAIPVSAQVTVAPAPYIGGTGTTKGGLTFVAVTTTINAATATGTGTGTLTSATTALPASTLILGVSCKVAPALAGAALGTFSLGDGVDADRFGVGILIANGTLVNIANSTVTGPAYQITAGSLVLTASAGVFSTGILTCVTHGLQFVLAGS